YNDTFYGGYISGANVTYTVGNLSGIMDEEAGGTYNWTIDTTQFLAQTVYIHITATKTNYTTIKKSFVFTIQPIPTVVVVTEPTLEGFPGDIVSFIVYYNDTEHGLPIAGALGEESSWEGNTTILWEDLGGGYYNITINIGQSVPRLYDVMIRLDKQNYARGSIRTNIIVRPTPAEIITLRRSLEIALNDTALVVFTLRDNRTNETISDVNGFAFWDTLGLSALIPMENGSHRLAIQAGSAVIVITFRDTVHNIGISDANVTLDYDQDIMTLIQETEENGVYTFYFSIAPGLSGAATFTFQKDGYVTQVESFRIEFNLSEEAILASRLQLIGGVSLIFLAGLLYAYVKVFSVPKSIRALNKMLKALRRGRIPKATPSPSRAEIILIIANEELSSVLLEKTLEDVTGETVEAVVPEVDALLDRLAEITGLEEGEIDAFRQDLARMKASERPGFLMEVIKQEEARRADALAGIEAEEIPIEEKRDVLGDQPEELDDLRRKLVKKGLGEDEIDVILEQAKSLSRADLEALLGSLGLKLD
ncbi:MAG: hypothetical protein ACW99J_18125, partial [Candidatus Thorarchaeota archaeon]